MKIIASLCLIAALAAGCTNQSEIDPTVAAQAIAGTIIATEQAQLTEYSLWLQTIPSSPASSCLPDSDCITSWSVESHDSYMAHCRAQAAFGTFAESAQSILTLVFTKQYSDEERVRGLQTLVQTASAAIEQLAPRLKPEAVVALRVALTAGTVAVLTLQGRKLPTDVPPAVEALRQDAVKTLARMRTFYDAHKCTAA